MRTVILSFLLCLQTVAPAASFWQRAVFNFSRQTYNAANQNWMVSQAENGWMYFANNKGLLEYDGVYWNTYAIDNGAKLRSLKMAGRRIYVGALGQFGYFEAGKNGRPQYTCLSKQLKNEGIINVWNIHTMGNSVYFQADGAVYVLENGHISKIPCHPGITSSYVIHNCLYVATSDGVYVLRNRRFEKLGGISLPHGAAIVALLPYGDSILVVTGDFGLYVYRTGELQRWTDGGGELIVRNKITCAAVSDRYLALGTTQSGVILVDRRSGATEQLSRDDGLQNKTVLAVTFDRDGNLWLGLDNGIASVVLNSHLSFMNSQLADIGAGYGSVNYAGSLYMGTNQGLYRIGKIQDGDAVQGPVFIEGTAGQVHTVDLFDGKLFCGGRNFFVMVDGNRVEHFPIRGVWHVCPVGHQTDALLLGDYWGLKVLRKRDGQWTVANKVEGTSLSAKTMMTEEDGNAVWVANKTMGLYRLTLNDSLTRVVRTRRYNTPQLPIGDNVCVTRINHEVVVAARQGLFRYNMADDRLEPHTQLEKLMGEGTGYTYIYQDERKNIWFVADGILGILRYDARHNTYYKNKGETYLSDELIEDFEHVGVMSGEQAIIGTQEGFALLNYGRKQTSALPLTLHIRRVIATNGNDSLLYSRSFYYEDSPLNISYAHNSLRIEFSANNYDKSQTVLYSFRLLGSPDDQWSSYSRQHIKEYTNLREGKYTFQVRIVTATNQQPVTASLTFHVLPPWYRSWWAYLLYALMLACVVWAVVRRLRKSTQMLNQKIETLEDEKMQIELRSKQNELMRSQMNVVRKNEMLQEIKKTAVSLNNSLSEDNLPSIKRKVVRLIGQIDTNMQHDDDLKAFKGDFDAVHHDFLKTLSERYPQLTYKDKMLCAYLKMNMLSKEIAPLLNISVRGVEISRYRLRKKLGLDEKENLSEFLQRIGGKR
ncbi:MAG: transcriptional regulator [Prevotella sp.]|nr:transcriptional regulator [Prevotella sp.]